MIPSHRISTLIELLTVLNEHCGDSSDFLFRGQCVDKPMLPRLGRLVFENTKRAVAEKRLSDDFRRQAYPFLDLIPDNEWDWLAIAQHHGMSTRLLDRTTNPLSALWFAVAQPPQFDSSGKPREGVVWILRIKEVDRVDPDKLPSPFGIKQTRVFRPKNITNRIIAQNGWFTAHALLDSKDNFLAVERNPRYRKWLRKISIPPDAFVDLRWDLDRCGVNAASMFPDVDGLCRHLDWSHSLATDER